MTSSSRVALFVAVVALLPAAVPARAEITPAARRIVERYLEATGGRTAFEAVRSFHSRGRLSGFGMTGTTHVWSRSPDRRASETRLGSFLIQDGWDGRVAWRSDLNGKIVVLDGKDLEDARASAWFQNERWLLSDQGGGRVRDAGSERDSAGAYDVLEVTPPIGRPRRFHFNTRTGLIDRSTMKRDQMTILAEVSDYRRAGDRLYPHRERDRILEMPANDATVVIDSIWTNVAIDESRFSPPAADTAAVSWLKTPGRAVLPFQYGSRHVWLKASVNGGEPADFIYDTGASITVIDSAFAARIGLGTEGQIQSQGAGAAGSASFSQLRSLRVSAPDGDGVELRGQKVAVLAVNRFLAPYFWRDCAGVLGYDFITRFVNEIDFDRTVLTLHDPATFTYSGSGAEIPFRLAGTIPAVHVKLDGTYEGDCRLDVGSSSTVDFHTPFVRRHDLTRKARKVIEATGGGFGGTFRTRVARMQKLELGPFSWERPIVSLSGAESGALASEDYAGNIGNQVLQRFKCTLDYERRRLYLEPGARFKEEDRFSRSGLLLVRTGEEVRAMHVLEGSPAARAGIRDGDLVIAVDRRPAGSWSQDELADLFETTPAGRKVAIEIERDGQRKVLRVELADIL